MAITKLFHGATINKPGIYGDPKWTPFFTKYGPLLQFLQKLGVNTNPWQPPRI